jgi:hypothetical protein
VLYTASKFFRSPPFCGAVIVPAEIMQKLQADQTAVVPHGLKTFVGQSELPDDLTIWRNQLDSSINHGLALRWEAGLAEIEQTLKIEESIRLEHEQLWRNEVIAELEKYDNLNYFSAANDTTSIVSIRIKSTKEGKEWFNKGELVHVFKAMTQNRGEQFPDSIVLASRKCFIGQPVVISPTEAVLRIALGSDSLRAYIADKAQTI